MHILCSSDYHSIKGREDEAHKSKTSQTRTNLRTNHVANPTAPDRQSQVAVIQHRNQVHPVMGKGSQENDVIPMNACTECDFLISELLTGSSYHFDE